MLENWEGICFNNKEEVFKLFKNKKSKGQNVIEYLLVVAVIAGAITAVATTIKGFIVTKADPAGVATGEDSYYTVKDPE